MKSAATLAVKTSLPSVLTAKWSCAAALQSRLGMRCLIVEDVVTTGGSVKEVIELVKAAGGVVVGVGSIVDRSNGQVDFGVPFKAVYPTEVVSWEADECPLCREGKLPAVKPGSRKAPGAK